MPDTMMPVAALPPLRSAALRDKRAALAHLQAAQVLVRLNTRVQAAEAALDNVDDDLASVVERVERCCGALEARP